MTSSHTKKQTVIIAEKDIPEQELKNAVAKAGHPDTVPWDNVWFCLCAVHVKVMLPMLPVFAAGGVISAFLMTWIWQAKDAAKTERRTKGNG